MEIKKSDGNRARLTVDTPAENVLAIVTAAIKDGSYVGSKYGAQAVNYGADGEIRYEEDGAVDGITVRVTWETTRHWDDYGDAADDYERITTATGRRIVLDGLDIAGDDEDAVAKLMDAAGCTAEDAERLLEIIGGYGYDPANSGFFDDESNACDWDNPVGAEITAR